MLKLDCLRRRNSWGPLVLPVKKKKAYRKLKYKTLDIMEDTQNLR